MTKLSFSPYLSIDATACALRSGELTSEALVETQLQRIARFDERLHAYVEVYAQEALQAARALDDLRRSGVDLGPLHGITVAIKDLFEIKGHRIQAGSLAREARVSSLTATVVERLRAAGAIILGKTHTVEYAFGGWGTNAVMGTPWNPWDLKQHRVPGGSSSGSAVAVSAGMCCAALGTDTGGSVRIPAGLCGLVGLKTTHGLVSRHGLVELCPTHDTVGPIARTVGDAALLLDAISGPDPLDPASAASPVRRVAPHLSKQVRGLRVWVLPQSERQGVEADVLSLYDRALGTLAELGMHLVERPLPQPLAESMRTAGELMSAEGYANLGDLFEREDLKFDPHVRRRILLGRDTGAAKYIALLKERDRARRDMLAALEEVDLLFMPTNAISAVPLSAVDELATPLSRFGRFANLLDLCSIAVQAGLSSQGMPISVQFVGAPLGEPLILRAAQAYERVTPWHTAVPSGLD
ncbi:MAG TPA: amidase [Burkholderiaceae bacterium]|nr:amidase [Burkholderiaceae bacterium]